jgi:hypothetical protein
MWFDRARSNSKTHTFNPSSAPVESQTCVSWNWQTAQTPTRTWKTAGFRPRSFQFQDTHIQSVVGPGRIPNVCVLDLADRADTHPDLENCGVSTSLVPIPRHTHSICRRPRSNPKRVCLGIGRPRRHPPGLGKLRGFDLARSNSETHTFKLLSAPVESQTCVSWNWVEQIDTAKRRGS